MLLTLLLGPRKRPLIVILSVIFIHNWALKFSKFVQENLNQCFNIISFLTTRHSDALNVQDLKNTSQSSSCLISSSHFLLETISSFNLCTWFSSNFLCVLSVCCPAMHPVVPQGPVHPSASPLSLSSLLFLSLPSLSVTAHPLPSHFFLLYTFFLPK